MKTQKEILEARKKLCERIKTPGLNDVQKLLVCGMLNALCWVTDVESASSTMNRMLSNEPMYPGKDPTQGLARLNSLLEQL